MTEAVKLYWDRGEEITHRLNVVYKEVELVGNEMSGIRAAEARAKWTEEDQNEQIKNLKKEINLIKGELLEVRAQIGIINVDILYIKEAVVILRTTVESKNTRDGSKRRRADKEAWNRTVSESSQ